jgi:hypothetical protein
VLAPSDFQYVTRLSHYQLLDDADVLDRLARQPWQRVSDSGSGPTRWATELGICGVDGQRVRLVVTRFESRDKKKHGAGTLIDGWQYEIFATGLDATAWPAAELVTLYYGRCGQENHFLFEDKALGLNHVFSYQLGAQLLANGIGLWLWNLRIILGAKQVGGLSTVPTTPAAREVSIMSTQSPTEPELASEIPVAEPGDVEHPSVASGVAPADGSAQAALNDVEDVQRPKTHATQPGDTSLGTDTPSECTATDEDIDLFAWIEAQLPNFPWKQRFEQMPGWTFDPVANRPVCPAAAAMRLGSARPTSSGGIEIRFRASQSDCRNCPMRNACTTSNSRSFAKEITFASSTPATTAETPSERTATKMHKSHASRPGDGHSRRSRRASKLVPADGAVPGPFAMRKSYLVALALMRAFTTAARNTLVHVQVDAAPTPPPPPNYYAMTDAKRQHRRNTWEELHAWNGLPPGSAVRVRMMLPRGATLLCEPDPVLRKIRKSQWIC